MFGAACDRADLGIAACRGTALDPVPDEINLAWRELLATHGHRPRGGLLQHQTFQRRTWNECGTGYSACQQRFLGAHIKSCLRRYFAVAGDAPLLQDRRDLVLEDGCRRLLGGEATERNA